MREAEEPADPVADAAERTTEAGSARVEGRMWIPIAGQRIRMEISGVVSFADDRQHLRMDFAENGVPGAIPRAMRALRWQNGYPRDQILDAGVAFIQGPRVRRLDAPDRWLFVDLARVQEAGDIDLRRLAGMPEVNPAAMLEFLRTSAESRVDGRETIDGESMRRHRVRIDYADHPSKVPEEKRAAAERTVALLARWWRDTARDVTVWIDPAGVIRR